MDEDAVGHINDTALLLPKALHTDMIAYPRAQLACQFFRHPHSQASRSYSSWLANDDLGLWMPAEDELRDLRGLAAACLATNDDSWSSVYEVHDGSFVLGDR